MCSNNTPPPSSHNQSTDSLSLTLKPPPLRKNRSKTRKPKFPSLQLISHHPPDTHDDHNVALLFTSDAAAATLSSLLQPDLSTTTLEEDSLSPPSLTHGGDNGRSLIRKAMRRRNEMCYSDVTSYCSSSTGMMSDTALYGLLSLKLDYEAILNAWSDRSLYVAGERPQSVPHLFLDALLPDDAYPNAWKVAGDEGTNSGGSVKEEMGKGRKLGQREANVLRDTRRRGITGSSLSLSVRYEVRRLNAAKRLRNKGQFAKMDEQV